VKKLSVTIKFFILSTAIFFGAQFVINSRLSPLGTQLQQLNTEKEYLVEINENINEELAKLDSIVVVKQLAQKKLEFDRHNPKSTIYLQYENVLAEK
jgi:hypothetical protein